MDCSRVLAFLSSAPEIEELKNHLQAVHLEIDFVSNVEDLLEKVALSPYKFILLDISNYSENISDLIKKLRNLRFSNPVYLISSADLAIKHKLLEKHSKYDPLTEIYNRNYFKQRLDSHLKVYSRISLIVLDIDRFSLINGSLGQEVGDRVLCLVAQRLRKITRSGDLVGRLGSDEFAIAVHKDSADEIATMLPRLLNDLMKPFSVNDKEFFLKFSLGISSAPEDGADSAALLRKSNLARTKVKVSGGASYLFYNEEINSQVVYYQRLILDLYSALDNNQLELYYQPQVSASSLELVGAEALLRWEHPELGFVSPEVFIPIAEQSNFINVIGDFVLEQAISSLGYYAANHSEGIIKLGINLSSKQLIQTDLASRIKDLLEKYQVPANLIELEVTESLLMSNPEQSIQTLTDLKKLGVSIALDDFGTGYSSLAYLHKLPLDVVKIDRSFIEDINSLESRSIVKSIVALSKSLNLSVIAEGVENQEQIDFLQELGCDILQGYLFGKAMQPDDFIEKVKSARKRVN